MMRQSLITIFCLSVFISCSEKKPEIPFPAEKNPWAQIRLERIKKLLPDAMRDAGVDLWVLFCRENNNDPLAMHVGGENASQTAAFLFFLEADSVRSLAISPSGEATALRDVGAHDVVMTIPRGANIWKATATIIEETEPQVIAINSASDEIADGLSFTQRQNLEKALGAKYVKRFVSSSDLVKSWLSVKTPREIEIMRKAADITARLQIEAYNTVIPGKTKDSDLARFLKRRMKELAVSDAWAPDQNPNVNSGPDRGHSHATDRIIQPGDIIQTDFGIKAFDIWCSDIQRFAYVLKPGESQPPADIQKYFDDAIKGHRKALSAMKPGVTGWQIDKTQRDWMQERGSLPVMWSTGHPVGYWAHDAGPALGGAARYDQPTGDSALKLKPGQTFAYDGFYCWQQTDSTTKTISVEEMAVITESGAEYMSTPQTEWIVISPD